MINIKLDPMFTMRSNSHCLQLCKQTIAGSDAKVPGEIKQVPIGDFTSFDSFMKQYVHHRLLNATDHNNNDITNFADLMEHLKQVLDQIKKIFDFRYLTGDKSFKQIVDIMDGDLVNISEIGKVPKQIIIHRHDLSGDSDNSIKNLRRKRK